MICRSCPRKSDVKSSRCCTTGRCAFGSENCNRQPHRAVLQIQTRDRRPTRPANVRISSWKTSTAEWTRCGARCKNCATGIRARSASKGVRLGHFLKFCDQQRRSLRQRTPSLARCGLNPWPVASPLVGWTPVLGRSFPLADPYRRRHWPRARSDGDAAGNRASATRGAALPFR